MGDFVLVACVGHCGSKWLAKVLNRPQDGMICMHEGRVMAMEEPWHVAFEKEWEDGVDAPEFNGFWRHVKRSLQHYDVVGDVNDWTPYIIPQVHQHQPISRIIYLVRNGIQTMRSMAHISSSWHQFGEASWPIDNFLHRYWHMIGEPGKGWEDRTRWEKFCVFWKLNWHMVSWLREQLPDVPVDVYRLEDLTSDVGVLRGLIESVIPKAEVSNADLERLQAKDVNRKVQGRRDTEYLWGKWAQEQRDAFETVCGEEMRQFGYEIPTLAEMDPLTIFSIPRAFEGRWDRLQRNAIESWTRLEGDPHIVLMAENDQVAGAVLRAGVESRAVAVNEQGTPLVSDAFAQMRERAGILAYLNTDCIFLDDLMPAVRAVATEFDEFLMVGRRYDLSLRERLEFGDGWQADVRGMVAKRGKLHGSWGVEYFIWRGDLFDDMPPFAVGRTAYDNWLVATALERGVPVVDATADVTCIHQEHTRGDRRTGAEAERNRELMAMKGCGVHDATWVLEVGQLRQKRTVPIHDAVVHRPDKNGLYVCTTWGRNPNQRYWRMMLGIEAWAAQHHHAMSYNDVHGKFGVAEGHNRLHEHFLASDKEYMLHLDDDCLIEPDSIERMASWQKPVVTALTFRRAPPYAPTVYLEPATAGGWKQDFEWLRAWLQAHLEQLDDINKPFLLREVVHNPLVSIKRCGAHCLLLHRDVLEAIEPPWFESLYEDGSGSDFEFCRKILEAGYPIYVDLSVIAGHLQGDYCSGPLDWLVWDKVTEYTGTSQKMLQIEVRRE